MFHYIRIRKKGNLIWKALREEGKILVFDRYENAKKHADKLNDFVFEIISTSYHPSHKKSQIYRKKYKRSDW